jgi:hypothetical protein
VDVIDGQAYEHVDLWIGVPWGESAAGTHLEPLNGQYTPGGQGQLWQPFNPWLCQ